MSFFAENWIIILVAFVSGAMLVWPAERGGGSGVSVPTSEAVRLINREKGVLVDVSEPNEFAGGHATGARNVPFGQVEGSKELPTNKALPVVLLCASGSRSARAVGILKDMGYERACSLQGGNAAWREASLPMESGAKPGK